MIQFQLITEMRLYNALYREIDKMYHEVALKMGLSDSALMILYAITELGDGCLQKDICELFFFSRQTINSACKKLEMKGIIYLEKGKRRDMHMHLTEAGVKLVQNTIVPLMKAETAVFAEMEPDEVKEFLRLTRKYTAIFRKKIGEL